MSVLTIALGSGAALAVCLAVRRWLQVNERDVDYEREYRPPPILGNWPNVPR